MQDKPLGQKRAADYILLIVCPLMILGGTLVQALSSADDMLRLYAWHALVVELIICYAPALAFIEKQGGKERFGLRPISPLEWINAAALGFASYYLLTAAGALSEMLFAALGASPAAGMVKIESGWRLAAAAVVLGIIPAIAEETLFRGVLLFSWAPCGKRRAMWHAAALFALVQLQPAYFPQLLLLGLLFSHIAYATGSVYPTIAIYSSNNIAALITLYSLSDTGVSAANEPAELAAILPGVALYLLMGAFLGIIAYRGLMRGAARRRGADMAKAQKLYKSLRDALDADAPIKGKVKLFAVSDAAPRAQATEDKAQAAQKPMPGVSVVVALTYAIMLLLNIWIFVRQI